VRTWNLTEINQITYHSLRNPDLEYFIQTISDKKLNETIIMPIENSYTKCNNNNNNDNAEHKSKPLHKITELYTKLFSVCPNITTEFRTTSIFKSSVKENNDSYESYRHVYDLSMYKTSSVYVHQLMSCLCKIKCEF
jgi:hypothetical protein